MNIALNLLIRKQIIITYNNIQTTSLVFCPSSPTTIFPVETKGDVDLNYSGDLVDTRPFFPNDVLTDIGGVALWRSLGEGDRRFFWGEEVGERRDSFSLSNLNNYYYVDINLQWILGYSI